MPSPDMPSPEVLCAGEILIDWVCPDRGAKLASVARVSGTSALTFHPAPGGAPANVAVGLARLGLEVGFAGKLAQDAWGEALLKLLKAEGIDTRHVVRDAASDTRMAYVLLDEAGERHLASFSKGAADARLSASDVENVDLTGVKALYLGSMMQRQDPSREAFEVLLARAAATGTMVVYDPNYRPVLWEESPSPEAPLPEARAREALESGARHADLLKLGAEELAFLTGTHELARGIARAWVRYRPGLLVVTDGPLGAFWKNAAGEGHVQAFPVPTLDPTGAGDGFVAGLIAGLLEACALQEEARASGKSRQETATGRQGPLAGCDPSDMLRRLDVGTMRHVMRRASAVGALVATRVGAMTALPTRVELEAWLAYCEG